MITQIGYFNSIALMVACLIAIVSLKMYKYRSIAMILAIQFLIITGYDLILPVSGVNDVIFTSLIYSLKLLMMTVFLMIYVYLGAWLLTITSAAIIGILSYSVASALYAITPLYYSELMQSALTAQLIAGIIGAFNGCRLFDKILRDNFGGCRDSTVSDSFTRHKK